MSIIIINKKGDQFLADSSKCRSMKAAHATNASEPDPKNIFTEKPMWSNKRM